MYIFAEYTENDLVEGVFVFALELEATSQALNDVHSLSTDGSCHDALVLECLQEWRPAFRHDHQVDRLRSAVEGCPVENSQLCLFFLVQISSSNRRQLNDCFTICLILCKVFSQLFSFLL